jgi:hypothetical protein
MVTVHRAYGFRFVIFSNDHDPPHVHVFGHGGEARIILEEPVRLDWWAGFGSGDLRKMILAARREREPLLAMWRKLHER